MVAITKMHAIYVPNSSGGKDILILNSYKGLEHFQYDCRWYKYNNKHAYDALGTGIHSYYVTE